MSIKDGTTSVFTDDSGSRKRVVMLVIRGTAGALGLGLAAVAVSVVGQVALPGLDAPLRAPGAEHARTSIKFPESAPERSTADGTVVADSKSPDSSAAPTRKPSNRATEPATPTEAILNGKPTAQPTTAADPVQTPGSPPTLPPGKSKIIDSDQ